MRQHYLNLYAGKAIAGLVVAYACMAGGCNGGIIAPYDINGDGRSDLVWRNKKGCLVWRERDDSDVRLVPDELEGKVKAAIKKEQARVPWWGLPE